MSPVRRIATLLLLALWLPALLHCRLEAAGLLFETDCCPTPHADAAPATDAGCAEDACDVAEGAFTHSLSVLTAPAPLLCCCLHCCEAILPAIADLPPPVTGIIEDSAAPPEVKRTWVFTTRAALSPRAPSLAS